MWPHFHGPVSELHQPHRRLWRYSMSHCNAQNPRSSLGWQTASRLTLELFKDRLTLIVSPSIAPCAHRNVLDSELSPSVAILILPVFQSHLPSPLLSRPAAQTPEPSLSFRRDLGFNRPSATTNGDYEPFLPQVSSPRIHPCQSLCLPIQMPIGFVRAPKAPSQRLRPSPLRDGLRK